MQSPEALQKVVARLSKNTSVLFIVHKNMVLYKSLILCAE